MKARRLIGRGSGGSADGGRPAPRRRRCTARRAASSAAAAQLQPAADEHRDALIAEAAGELRATPRRRARRSTRSGSPTSSGRARPATRPTTRSPARCCAGRCALAPRDLLATSGLGSLALSRHRFREALVLGRRAHAISPTTARNYGVDRRRARRARPLPRRPSARSTRWRACSPSLSSYARIAHARELLGDVPGAIDAMKLARRRRAGQGETEAWTHVQLGKVYSSVGRLRRAPSARTAPRCARFPATRYALRRARAGRGGAWATAARRSRSSSRRSTGSRCRSTSAMLGDLYRVDGQTALAHAGSTR